jgi:hypothetical protein
VEGAGAGRRAGAAPPRAAADGQARHQGAKRRGRPWRTTPAAGAQRRADPVERDFTAVATNGLCVCDFTYLRCWEGVVFFAETP